MNIDSIRLYTIQMPLKNPFSTHLSTVKDREAIIVVAEDKDGQHGLGEVVAFSSPWYTEETVKTSYHMLKDFLIPLLQKEQIRHPQEAFPLFERLRRNYMAKAGLETALWDLYAKQKGQRLASLIGGTRTKIPAGVVVGAKSKKDVIAQIESYIEAGYERVKVKISPENDYEFLAEIRKHFPTLTLMADANSAYTKKDIDHLRKLDQFELLLIEQPFAHDDIIDHASLQKEIATPVCLDESIVTLGDAEKAIKLGSCKVINIKIGRVGGIQAAKAIHDHCMNHQVQVWCGGMLEFGVSRAHNIALATLPGFTIPGDISSSSRYWEEDIIMPEVMVKNGFIDVPEKPGIGFDLNEKRLKEVVLTEEKFTFIL